MSSEKEPGFLLSILIPTMPVRAEKLQRLMEILTPQLINDIEVIIDIAMGMSIGVKRQAMLEAAKGKYVCFIDDDDRVSDDYVALLREGMEKDVDCCSLTGLYNPDNGPQQMFIHSIRYDNFFEQDKILYRCPNHLNVVKRIHALECTFPDCKFGEDTNYAFQLLAKGLLKTEHWIEQTIYFYDYISNKPTFYK